MPIKFSLTLKLKSKVENPSLITPDVLHGFFYSLLPEEMAERLHRPSRYKPFCIWAPRIFKFQRKEEDSQGSPLEALTITISLLKEELFSPLLSHLTSLRKKLFLGPYRVSLVSAPGSFIKNDLYRSFEDFLENELSPYFYFNFYTPVSFKKNDIDYPLPEPKLVFKSLLNRWNYFAPMRVAIDLRSALEERLCMVFAKIRTYKIKLSLGSGVTGFKGKVVYYLKKAKEEELRWLNALGHFATFSGVGRKTTMGLGMTEFTNTPPEEVEV